MQKSRNTDRISSPPDPNDIAGNVLDIYTQEAAISRELGNALLPSNTFSPGFSVSGGAGLLAPTASGNTMAQITNAVGHAAGEQPVDSDHRN